MFAPSVCCKDTGFCFHVNELLLLWLVSVSAIFGGAYQLFANFSPLNPFFLFRQTKERHKLEALKKKQEQEEERMKKMEEERKRKQEELKRLMLNF